MSHGALISLISKGNQALDVNQILAVNNALAVNNTIAASVEIGPSITGRVGFNPSSDHEVLPDSSAAAVLGDNGGSVQLHSGLSTTRKGFFIPSSGMALNFVAPCVNNGVVKDAVDKDEIRVLKPRWNFTMAMFIIGFQLNFMSFNRFVSLHWPSLTKFNTILHRDGYYLVQCSSDD